MTSLLTTLPGHPDPANDKEDKNNHEHPPHELNGAPVENQTHLMVDPMEMMEMMETSRVEMRSIVRSLHPPHIGTCWFIFVFLSLLLAHNPNIQGCP